MDSYARPLPSSSSRKPCRLLVTPAAPRYVSCIVPTTKWLELKARWHPNVRSSAMIAMSRLPISGPFQPLWPVSICHSADT
jgi:hypothetical protein